MKDKDKVLEALKNKAVDLELDYLVWAVSTKRPFTAIVGGSKVSSKIGVIESLLEKCDVLLLGGAVETRTLAEVHEVLEYASQTKTSLTRIMLDNMVIPLSNGDVEVSMLKEAVDLINGRFETETQKIRSSGIAQRANKIHSTNVKVTTF
ncbi:nicotinate-nucleotide pyrophosphorylase [Capsicum galapagoense]